MSTVILLTTKLLGISCTLYSALTDGLSGASVKLRFDSMQYPTFLNDYYSCLSIANPILH